MPATSKAQFRFMQMLAHNPKKMKDKPEGMSPAQAEEYVSHNKGEESYKNLPERAKPKKRKYKSLGEK